jgi:DNA ligase (NAD+)
MAEIVKKLIHSKKDAIEVASELSIEELESVIPYAADKYYNTKSSVITDALYDVLIDFLKLRKPKSVVLKNIGAKVKSKNKVKLDYWLGSMDKIKPPSTQLAQWTKRYKGPYNLSDKLDGISALLVYNDDKISMYTRGTATEGTDITNLVKYLDLPSYESIEKYCKKNKIKGDVNMVAFRGELIIKEDVFQKKFSDKLKNTRNSVAGLVNSKTINPELAHATDLVLYEIIDPFYPIEQQFDIIKEMGFITVNNKTIKIPPAGELTFNYLSEYLKKRRETSPYMIDGIIVTSCGKNERNVDGNPEYAFAFKDILEDQMATTTVIEVEWNVSKDGYMKPTLLLEPVVVGGVEIRRATGNNARYIVDNMLGPGAEIEIIRSGDVIPKVTKVIKKAKKPQLPAGSWHWNETEVDIMIDDMNSNKEMLVRSIYFFFSSLDTKGMGEKNVEKLVNAGYDSIEKIIEATEEDMVEVEGFGKKTAANLVLSIKKALTNISLARLMASSNKLGHGLGEERMKQILLVYPNLMTEYVKWSKSEMIEKLRAINGWEEKTSTLFASNFQDFIEFYNNIKDHIVLESKKKQKTGEFTGKTVVFSSFRDPELKEKIENQGGKVGSSVSKNTDYLVVKDKSVLDDPTDKITKAIELEIKILTKDKLIKMLE